MKIIIEGNEKKLKQLFKELVPRAKYDKVSISIKEKEELIENGEEKPKRGRKPVK